MVRTGHAGAGQVGDHVEVLEEGEGAVDAVGLAGARGHPGDGPVGEHRADRAPLQDVASQAQDGEVGRVRAGVHLVPGLDVQGPHVERADLAGHPRATDDGHEVAFLQPDLPAVEELRYVDVAEEPAKQAGGRTEEPAGDAALRKAEDAPPLEEELALLREEEREAGQVHLPLVHLHLREVGVQGEVGGQVLGDAVLDVDAGRAATLVVQRRVREQVGGHTADRVGFDLDVAARRGRFETHQRPGRRDAEDTGRPAAAAGRDGQPRQIGVLVLAADAAAKLNAPDVRRLRPVAERLERNLHLDRPAAVEAAGPHVPHRVPVGVRVALVRELLVGAPAERVGVEHEAVAAVVERVEERAEVVVLAELGGVAAHLVRNPLAPGRRVPHPGGDVDIRVVEHDPRLGRLGRGRAGVGNVLDEVGDRRHRLVDRLVEDAVEADALLETDRPYRGPPLLVTRHHRRRHRWWRPVDEAGIDHDASRCGDREAGTRRGLRLVGLHLGRRRGRNRERSDEQSRNDAYRPHALRGNRGCRSLVHAAKYASPA